MAKNPVEGHHLTTGQWPLEARYHMAHHRNQGVEGIDTDVPTLFEGYIISKSCLASEKDLDVNCVN